MQYLITVIFIFILYSLSQVPPAPIELATEEEVSSVLSYLLIEYIFFKL